MIIAADSQTPPSPAPSTKSRGHSRRREESRRRKAKEEAALATPPSFTDQDRDDFRIIRKDLDVGIKEERRYSSWIVCNSHLMVTVRDRNLWYLDGANNFYEWIYNRYKIGQKQADKYLCIGRELKQEDVAGRALSFNATHEVALSEPLLRPVIIRLGEAGLNRAALSRGRRIGAILLEELEEPGPDPEQLKEIEKTVETVARGKAAGRGGALRTICQHMGRVGRSLLELEEKQLPGEPLPADHFLIEGEARATFLTLCRMRAKASGKELDVDEVNRFLDHFLPREESADAPVLPREESTDAPVLPREESTPPVRPQPEVTAGPDPLVNPSDRDLPEEMRQSACSSCGSQDIRSDGLLRHQPSCARIPEKLMCLDCHEGADEHGVIDHMPDCRRRLYPKQGHRHSPRCRTDPRCWFYQGTSIDDPGSEEEEDDDGDWGSAGAASWAKPASPTASG